MPREDVIRRVEAQEGKPLVDALIAALREADGDISAVARRLGVDRNTVYAWMRKHGIERRTVVLAD